MEYLKELRRCINKGDKVLVAVSGGMDSVFLLDVLFNARRIIGFELCAATVNHSLRGEESERDAIFTEGICKDLGVEFFRADVDVLLGKGKGFNLEQEARRLRYEALNRIADINKCNKLATAHHAQDNAESVLLNLFRGAGAAGAAAMSKAQSRLIRPIITLTKEEIEGYVHSKGLKYVTDSSNYNDDFSRNYLRNNVLPLITKRYPGAVKNISEFSLRAAEDEEFITSLVKITTREDGVIINKDMFTHKSLCMRAVKQALMQIGIYKDIGAKNYADIFELINKETGRVILLKNATAEKVKNAVLIKALSGEEKMSNQVINKDIDRVLLSEEDIKNIVERLAEQINRDYDGLGEVVVIGILKGSVFFLTDLVRRLNFPVVIDFMSVSSYSGAHTSGEIKILKDINVPLTNRHVIIIEDIIDTGLTLKTLQKTLSVRAPKSVKIASLLDKPSRRKTQIEGDYIGQVVPDEFIVGYGLDYNQNYRILPYIGTLKPELYKK